MSAIKKSRGDRAFNAFNGLFLALFMLATLYPLYFTVVASVSDPYTVVRGGVYLFPKGFTLEAYQNAFKESRIWIGYRNNLFYTAVGTLWNLILTMPAAYVLSKKRLKGRGILAVYFLIPMYFNGGLVPTYFQVKNMGLVNNLWSLIFIESLSVYNVIIARVSFQTTVPEELYESARIDGASELCAFFRIALPLVKPIIAVVALFYAVGRWNDYFTALIYVSNSDLQPLQIVLRGILLLNQTAVLSMQGGSGTEIGMAKEMARLSYMAEAMKYALIFISSAPLLIAYPFVQKYFVKGVMVGSLKG